MTVDRETWSQLDRRGRRLAIERPATTLNVLASKAAVLAAGAAIAVWLVLATAIFDESGWLKLSPRALGGRASAPSAETATPLPSLVAATPAASEARRVGNTGGEGVYLRRTPRPDDRLRHLSEGATVLLLGPRVESGGLTWLKVQDATGDEGWLPEQYLLLQ
ncbi:MAG: hypothetical protein HY331_17185 [Chloroflexi bacterium]|nr:hypothetical protein [Chloroflexota bacterium]